MDDNQNNEGKVRLSKIMGQRGLCSRREADDLISKQLVKVDGELVTQLGFKTHENCKIEILERGQHKLKEKMTIALNKPRDYVSSQPEKNYVSALELIRSENYFGDEEAPYVLRKGLAPLGRLDIDSTGLILYSQNGVLAKKIIGENTSIEKEYEVNITGGTLTPQVVSKLKHGLSLDGVQLKPAKVFVKSDTLFNIVLKQGRKRQIRRMCDLVGLKSTRIHRIRIGKLHINELPEGQWVAVSEKDII